MTYAENTHDTVNRHVTVKREIPRGAVGDHQFAHLPIPYPSDQRVICENLNGGSNCLH